MSRKCQLTGKGPLVGNKVSHANNKTKMRQLPNLKSYKIVMPDGTIKKVKISAAGIRTLRKYAREEKIGKELKI